MRNLKRALSLAMASVMLLGMMVVGTGASYADVTSKNNQEAIEVMQAVGVMVGDTNGNFNPDQKVTRVEMAVVMSNLLNLNVKDFIGAKTPFTDVPEWAVPYVAACYADGITAGISATEYGSNYEVTTAQAALMMMKALGYFQNAKDFGSDWQVATVKQGSKIELFDGVEAGASTAMTRNDVAQIALNTLEATMVETDGTSTDINLPGDISISTGDTKYVDRETTKYDYTKANGKYAEGSEKTLQLCESLYGSDLTKITGTDDFGRSGDKWSYDGDEVGVYGSEADYTFVMDSDDSLTELLADEKLELNLSSSKYVGSIAVNGAINTYDADDNKTASNISDEAALAAGKVVELYTNDSDKIDSVVVYNYVIAKVDSVEEYDSEDELAEDYNASVEYTLVNLDGDAYDDLTYVDNLSEDNDGYQAIGTYDEGDVLAIVIKADGKIIAKELAKSVDGVMTAKGEGYVKVDGTKYTAMAGTAAANYEDTYTYYMDPNGVIVGSELYEEANATLDYVYVISSDATTSDDDELINGNDNRAVVKVMYTDGTSEVVDYALTKTSSDDYASGYYFKVGSAKYDLGSFESTVTAGWYAYTKNSDDEITLKSAVKADKSGVESVKVEKDQRTLNSGLYATTSTEVVVFNKDGVANTYKGYANFPSDAISKQALVVYGSSEKYADKVYIYDENASADSDKIDVALFVSKGDETADGIVCEFYVDGKKVTYTVDADDSALSSAVAGQLFEIDVEEDIATLTALTQDDDYILGTVQVASDDYVVVSGQELDLTDDCAVYQVSKSNKTVTSGTLDEDQTVAVFTNDDGAYLIFIYKEAPEVVGDVKSSDASFTMTLEAGTASNVNGDVKDGYTISGDTDASKTATLTITPADGATVTSVTADSEDYVTVSGSGNSHTVTTVANGTATLTIKVTAEDGHTTSTQTLKVTVSGIDG